MNSASLQWVQRVSEEMLLRWLWDGAVIMCLSHPHERSTISSQWNGGIRNNMVYLICVAFLCHIFLWRGHQGCCGTTKFVLVLHPILRFSMHLSLSQWLCELCPNSWTSCSAILNLYYLCLYLPRSKCFKYWTGLRLNQDFRTYIRYSVTLLSQGV